MSNGRPEPEVIINVGVVFWFYIVIHSVCVQFVDGCSYSKNRLEEAFKSGGILDKHPTRQPKDSTAVKRDDVDLIVRRCNSPKACIYPWQVHELEIPRAQAEKALVEHKGDLARTLRTLVSL
jgi:NACalpha-BTF3-like transcription factor